MLSGDVLSHLVLRSGMRIRSHRQLRLYCYHHGSSRMSGRLSSLHPR